ncbi:hypothetical protein CMQ_5328 [Grosmannia clavigera kw1407]|uniref:Uncharacterized protein n=1 Tax=Grosmannia clavigera (strain kw1407 / UAMH 11150) TaxID=655863 RepID=F0XBU1_GROCL|nr:uncharacterized protein CMQ_5328 [Grosmannia clavigera kw1407]EFX05066.1 hypothetical protein CMQ_5328 [Grosmannia clavigera kw1407]
MRDVGEASQNVNTTWRCIDQEDDRDHQRHDIGVSKDEHCQLSTKGEESNDMRGSGRGPTQIGISWHTLNEVEIAMTEAHMVAAVVVLACIQEAASLAMELIWMAVTVAALFWGVVVTTVVVAGAGVALVVLLLPILATRLLRERPTGL